MTLQRATVLNALFSLVSASSAWKTAERRLVPWTSTIEQPAIFQRLVGETHEPLPAYGLPQRVTMHVELWLYAKVGVDDYPEDVFLPLLDAIDTALAANSTFDGRQTLGYPDLIEHAWREGQATYSQGEMGDQVVCLVPVHIAVVGQLGSS